MKVHFADGGWSACGREHTDFHMTTDLDAVTCRACLRSVNSASGRGAELKAWAVLRDREKRLARARLAELGVAVDLKIDATVETDLEVISERELRKIEE